MRSVQREVSTLFSQRSNRTESDWNATLNRHEAIFRAVSAGDVEQAERSIVVHYEAADVASLEVADKLDSEPERQE
jgi:GntR family transcriptional repressor for pyruvate dehydrogenase complex